MATKLFTGCGTALVTPFRDGRVDYASLSNLVMLQLQGGVDFLVPLGSTAETPCLDEDEKIQVLSLVRQLAPSTPLVAGCGTNSLNQTIHNIRTLEACSPDGFLVVVPYYNKPTQEGMYQYFRAVADSTDKPIILYNVPGRTGSNMLAQTTLRLAEVPNIVGVKEASGNIPQILDIVRNAPEGFSVLSGDDDQTLDLMLGGADGVVSVASNIAPGKVSRMVHLAASGKIREAVALNEELSPLYSACFTESNPIPVKGGLSLMGLCTPEMRLPLTSATTSTLSNMATTLSRLSML